MQSAEKAGASYGDAFDARFCQFCHMLHGVGLQPFLTPKDRLKGHINRPLVPAQFLAQQTRRFGALAVIGVALHQIAQGHAVIAGDQLVGDMIQLRIGVSDRAGQGVEI